MATREEATQLIEELTALEGDRRFQNLVAQAHSRAVLLKLQTPPEAWPEYTLADDDLLYTAHYLFWQGLQIKSVTEYSTQGDQFIKLGCEILEFLYASRQAGYLDRTKQLFNAALGYYISGYYARAYVLMQDLQLQIQLPQELELLRRLFEKDLSGMRQLISTILDDSSFSDAAIATGLRAGTVTEDEALHRIHHMALNRAFSHFIEYPKTGNRALLERAREILDRGIQLSLKTGYADWWWLFYCTRYLLDEYDANSFWTVLSPMGGDDPTKRLVEPYIRANYLRRRPVIELWRSQKAALPYINESRRGSYCLKMPTSAGKTRVAELAILRFLLDHATEPDAKCLYVAPFRSLAIEVESSLRESFHPLGKRVSELYGGFELSPIERLLMDETQIIVATPEKISAFLRYNPEIANLIGLIIIDEGHIISLSDRGLHYEFFLHRLVRRFARKGVRMLFLSAVLPNTDDFAQWITGSSEDVIASDWRPSRLLLGELRWNGKNARIEYVEADHKPLGHPCFVPNFITRIKPSGLPGIRYRRPFPADITEVVAEAGVRFAQNGTTMIFCARRDSVNPVARSILRSLEIHTALAKQKSATFSLPIDQRFNEAIEGCLYLAYEHMGEDNDVAAYLRVGFVIHHSDIPKPVRIELERLVRIGAVRLIVATTTLAQGVNFPIQTVLVHGLSHGHDEELTPVTFWNICGRAGRGMYENEGQILFAVDIDLPHVRLADPTGLSTAAIARRVEYKRRMRVETETGLRKAISDGYYTYRLTSSLQRFLVKIMESWQTVHANINVAELCARLAENDLDWLLPEQKRNIRNWLDVLDTELLAMIEEQGLVAVSPDIIQNLMEGSLAVVQAAKFEDAGAKINQMRDILFARWQYVSSSTRADDPRESAARRRRFYRLGFSLDDCQRIEADAQELLALLVAAEGFELWTAHERCVYLQGLAGFLIGNISVLKPEHNAVYDCWELVLGLWLTGHSPNEIVVDETVSQFTHSPAEVSAFIEDVFVYKLPWGFNALNAYLSDLAIETGGELPQVVSFFSALVKYGVHDPVASCLLVFGIESRQLALRLSAGNPHDKTEATSVLAWFLGLTDDNLGALALNESELSTIHSTQDSAQQLRQGTPVQPLVMTIEVVTGRSGTVSRLASGDNLNLRLLSNVSPRAYSLETLSGAHIGSYELDQTIPESWGDASRVSTQVVGIEEVDDQQLRLRFEVTAM